MMELIGRRMISLNLILFITTSLAIAVWALPQPVPRTDDAISQLFAAKDSSISRDANHLKTTAIGSRLQKRVVQTKTLRVIVHYSCPLSGQGQKVLQWTVAHDSEEQPAGVDFITGTSVDSFPARDKDYNDDEYPATYEGSWFHRDLQQIDVGTHTCQLDYTGHFEGEVGFSFMSLVFISNHVRGAPIPTITEHCRKYKTNECGKRVCAHNPVTKPCNYWHSEVFPVNH